MAHIDFGDPGLALGSRRVGSAATLFTHMLWPLDPAARDDRVIEVLGLVSAQVITPKGARAPARQKRAVVLNDRLKQFASDPKQFVLQALGTPWLSELVVGPVPSRSDCVTTGLVALTRIILKRAGSGRHDGSGNRATFYLERLGGIHRGKETLLPKYDNDMVSWCAPLASVSHFWCAYLLMAEHWTFERIAYRNFKTFLGVAKAICNELQPLLDPKVDPWLLPDDLKIPAFQLEFAFDWEKARSYLQSFRNDYDKGARIVEVGDAAQPASSMPANPSEIEPS